MSNTDQWSQVIGSLRRQFPNRPSRPEKSGSRVEIKRFCSHSLAKSCVGFLKNEQLPEISSKSWISSWVSSSHSHQTHLVSLRVKSVLVARSFLLYCPLAFARGSPCENHKYKVSICLHLDTVRFHFHQSLPLTLPLPLLPANNTILMADTNTNQGDRAHTKSACTQARTRPR